VTMLLLTNDSDAEALRDCWRDGVLSLLADDEASVAAAANEALTRALWQPMIDADTSDVDNAVWHFFVYLMSRSGALLATVGKKAPRKLTTTLRAHIEAASDTTSSAHAAWQLLASLASTTASTMQPASLATFATPIALQSNVACRADALAVLAHCCSRLPLAERHRIASLLFKEAKSLQMSPTVFQSTCQLLANVSRLLHKTHTHKKKKKMILLLFWFVGE
jgi:hypothetical protein